MGYKSSSYYFMVFIVISVGFLSFISTFRKILHHTNEEFLQAHMRIAQAEVLNLQTEERSLENSCIYTAEVIFVENLARDESGGLVCRDSDNSFLFAIKTKDQWYCVDGKGFTGFIKDIPRNATACTS